jgi:serine/threonine-protein kinase RsbW
MQFEACLISLDARLADEFGAALGEQRAALRPLADAAAFWSLLDDEPAARAVVVVDDAAELDPAWWRGVRQRSVTAQLLIVCRQCSDESWRRWMVLGAANVLRPPFTGIDLEAEFAGEPSLSNLFRRHPGLAALGKTMFRYSFPSDPQYIPGMVHVVALLAMEFGFEAGDYAMNLPLAVDEAISNAIIHGNRRDLRKRVEVEGQIDAEALRIKVRDEGEGYRRDPAHDPIDPQNLLASSGRGLFLIESIMDEVRLAQEGRCIEMVRRNRPRPPN